MNQPPFDVSLPLTRRNGLRALAGAAALACEIPARLALAAPSNTKDNSQQRLVVIMLRGALDGLAAVPATGDPAWADLRGHAEAAARNQALASVTATATGIAVTQATQMPLDTTFSLHPALATLHQWYLQKDLLVVHAVASPYRERSHFDAQQLLESGGDRPFVQTTGWLGRALQSTGQPALALTAAMPLALRGADSASTWTPAGRASNHQDLMTRVAQMYSDDVQLANALSQAMGQNDMGMGMGMGANDGPGLIGLARQAGKFLSDPKGPRVAWLEAGGWDTHTQQAGRLGRLLPSLDEALSALRNTLGLNWASTTVLVMTEFGRSAALNGSGGTDHGTGGVAFLAGGEVAGGRVVADWPGLARGQLFDGRDLKPTLDIRRLIGPVLQRQFSFGASGMERILPGAPTGLLDLYRT
jgi:uncharacterized protein (DUF1501 family)